MGCCCKNKNEETKNDSRKTKGSIKDDYKVKNNCGDKNDGKNNLEYANYIADNKIIKNTGTKEENSFDSGNNRDKEENNKENFENKKNYILAEINIDENNINENIRIINTFEETKRKYKWYDKNDDNKYTNEKEIKDNCTINLIIILLHHLIIFINFMKKEILK